MLDKGHVKNVIYSYAVIRVLDNPYLYRQFYGAQTDTRVCSRLETVSVHAGYKKVDIENRII